MENKNMGEVIAGLRRQHHMTQADLAAKMGVTDKAVSKWERNLSRPDVDSLPLLAETLHTTVETLLTAQSPAKKSPARIFPIPRRGLCIFCQAVWDQACLISLPQLVRCQTFVSFFYMRSGNRSGGPERSGARRWDRSGRPCPAFGAMGR